MQWNGTTWVSKNFSDCGKVLSGPNGEIYLMAHDGETSIYRYTGGTTWHEVPGPSSSVNVNDISVGALGYIYATTATSEIFVA